MNYTIYKNGPWFSSSKFLLELLKFWKWKKMSKSWIKWCLRMKYQRMFGKFQNPKEEFDYFMNKHSKRLAWFALNNFIKLEKKKK